MNKIIKGKLIGVLICFILGIGSLIYLGINHENISEDLISYISGFSTGIIAVGIVTLFKYSRAIKDKQISKKLENVNNDERLKLINNESMAISFRISVFSESIVSIVCALCERMEFAKCMGFIVCFQLVLYLIVYFIENKKN